MQQGSHPFQGLFDYTDKEAVFSDCFSPLALSAAGTDALGIHGLYLKGLNLSSVDPILQPFLRVFAKGTGEFEPVGCLSRLTHPGGWSEEGMVDGFRINTEVWFISDSCLCLKVTACTTDGKGERPRIALGGSVLEGSCTLGGSVRDGLMLEVGVPSRNFLGLDSSCAGFLEISVGNPVTAGFLPGDWSMTTQPDRVLLDTVISGNRMGYWIEPSMAPVGNTWECLVNIRWTVDGGKENPAYTSNSTLEDADTRWMNVIDKLPDTDPKGLYWRRKLAQAVACVVGCSVKSPGYGNASEDICILSSARDWSSTYFFWDHMISGTVLGLVDPEWQASAIRFGLKHTSNGRMAPGIVFAFPKYGDEQNTNACYAPVTAWSVAKSVKCSPAGAKVKELYPYLKGCNDGWFLNADRDGDGIPEWVNTGFPGDNSPLYDRYAKNPGETNFEIPPFVSANLCSYLLMDTRILLGFARKLGLDEDVEHWEAREAFLQRTLIDRLWDSEGLTFVDLTPEGEPVKVDTFFNLLPFWAGVDLPEATARKAIEKHLLNTGELWGDIPFPSAAYSEPTYDATGYWRGRCWPHVYFWCTELLWKYGYHEEAEKAKDIYLKLMAGYKYPVENFPSDPGRINIPGIMNYNWGAAATVHFLLDWHRMPL